MWHCWTPRAHTHCIYCIYLGIFDEYVWCYVCILILPDDEYIYLLSPGCTSYVCTQSNYHCYHVQHCQSTHDLYRPSYIWTLFRIIVLYIYRRREFIIFKMNWWSYSVGEISHSFINVSWNLTYDLPSSRNNQYDKKSTYQLMAYLEYNCQYTSAASRIL